MRFIISRELKCTYILSICFLILYTTGYIMLNIQKTLVSSIADEQPGFHVDGYTVTAITKIVFTIVVLFAAPYISHAIGPRLTMFICAFGTLVSLASFLLETPWVMYLAAVVEGSFSGTIWPAHSRYLIQNSSPKNTARNASIFWLTYMFSTLIGNMFVYYSFQNKKYIDRYTRRDVVYCLVAVHVVGVVAFAFLPKSSNKLKTRPRYGPIETLKTTWRLMKLNRMMWLCVYFAYSGLQQSMWQTIYSSAVGFTLAFGDSAKDLVGLSGIVMSVGAAVGALIPLVLSGCLTRQRWGRRVLVVGGGVASLCTAVVAFLDLPDDSVFGNTNKLSIIKPPSVAVALLGSFSSSLSDSVHNTQVYSMIGDHYRDYSAEVYALFKFVKSIFMSVSFFWCSYLGLHIQVAILAAAAVLGVVSFCVADWDNDPHALEEEVTPVENTKG